MIIAIDYDGTYSADPPFWDDFIRLGLSRGHKMIGITKHETDIGAPGMSSLIEVFYTHRKAKVEFMAQRGIKVDIWVDDDPLSAFRDG